MKHCHPFSSTAPHAAPSHRVEYVFALQQTHSSIAQVTPCASPNPSDDQTFETDAATQHAGLDLIAGTTAAWVRAFNEGDAAAREYLGALKRNPRVSEAETAPGCGFDGRTSDA